MLIAGLAARNASAIHFLLGRGAKPSVPSYDGHRCISSGRSVVLVGEGDGAGVGYVDAARMLLCMSDVLRLSGCAVVLE